MAKCKVKQPERKAILRQQYNDYRSFPHVNLKIGEGLGDDSGVIQNLTNQRLSGTSGAKNPTSADLGYWVHRVQIFKEQGRMTHSEGMIGCLKSIRDRKRSSPVGERQLRLQYLGNMMTNIIALQALALTRTIKAAVLWCLITQVRGWSALSSLDKSKTKTGQNVAGVGACRQLSTSNPAKCKTAP
jgi:hypothetical protein